MSAVERITGAVDGFQQRWPVLAFPVAVWKKFADDRAGSLAALISYYGFAALLPMLLVLVTVLSIVLKNHPGLHTSLQDSALANYPIIGTQVIGKLGSVSDTGAPLAVGIVLLLLGARGVGGAMQNALCEVWGIPVEERPGFPWSQLQGMVLVLVIGIGFIVTTFLSGLAGGAGHLLSGPGAYVGAVAVSLVTNVGLFWLAFRIATAGLVRWRDLRTGAAVAAIFWQVLQVVGGYVISHQLARSSELYGTFGVVLGLLAWLYLQAEITLYAAEVDVVLTRRLWPRSLRETPAGAAEAKKTGETAETAEAEEAGHRQPDGVPTDAAPRDRAG